MLKQEKANKDIRERLAKHDITQWQLADYLGVHHITVNTHLRLELNDEKKKEYNNAIDKIISN